jgi:hypothetical protein
MSVLSAVLSSSAVETSGAPPEMAGGILGCFLVEIAWLSCPRTHSTRIKKGDRMSKFFEFILVLGSLAPVPLLAAHANPWMEEGDDVLMQYHDDNLVQSEDTPGEDEMLGTMVREATGKIELDAGSDDGRGLAQGHAGGGAQGGGSGGASN